MARAQLSTPLLAVLIGLIAITGFAVIGKGVGVKECADGKDNDGDGFIDLKDPGCPNKKDNDETNCGDARCEGGEDPITCAADCGPIGPVCGDGTCDAGETQTNCPTDCGGTGPVCGDKACQPPETYSTCPGDCPPICGDGTCNGSENSTSCPVDCPPVCGDGKCESPETRSTCPADCPPVCGDGTCESPESSSSCPADCGGNQTNQTSGICGDGQCGSGESCVADCTIFRSICGDAACDPDETSSSCPTDCTIGGWHPNCVDTDRGKDYFSRGEAINGDVGPGEYFALPDQCAVTDSYWGTNPNILGETYCDGAGLVQREMYTCPLGCKKGSCIAQATCGDGICQDNENCAADCTVEKRCRDTDGGIAPEKAGVVMRYGAIDTGEQFYIYRDACNFGTIREGYCNSQGVIAYIEIGCSGGCFNGACVSTGTACGNGMCESGESSSSCPADCGTPPPTNGTNATNTTG